MIIIPVQLLQRLTQGTGVHPSAQGELSLPQMPYDLVMSMRRWQSLCNAPSYSLLFMVSFLRFGQEAFLTRNILAICFCVREKTIRTSRETIDSNGK